MKNCTYSKLLNEAERYHRWKNRISNLQSKIYSITKYHKTFHLTIVAMLCVTYIFLFNFFQGNNSVWFNLSQNLILSSIAADIFYFFVQVIPDEKKRKRVYQITATQLKNDVDLYINCVYSMIRFDVNTQDIRSNNVSFHSENILTTLRDSSLWDQAYMTCDWRTFGSGLAYTGYGKFMIDIHTSLPLSYKDIFAGSSRQLKNYISNLIIKYGLLLDFDYLELLEKILETDLMFHIESFSSLNSDERAQQVTRSLKYILQLSELNNAFVESNNRSTLAKILCKLPIRV